MYSHLSRGRERDEGGGVGGREAERGRREEEGSLIKRGGGREGGKGKERKREGEEKVNIQPRQRQTSEERGHK